MTTKKTTKNNIKSTLKKNNIATAEYTYTFCSTVKDDINNVKGNGDSIAFVLGVANLLKEHPKYLSQILSVLSDNGNIKLEDI